MPQEQHFYQGGRVLIVEDQGIVATDIKRCLEDAGFEVTGLAGSMDEAIREVSASRPDLVLMDIRIKGDADGIEVAKYLRLHFELPVVYLTAHDDRDTLERAKRAEPVAYLIKPFKPVELINTVELAIKRSRADQQVRERERFFLSVMDAIGDGVLTADSEGRVRFMNRAAEELTGRRQEDALDQPAVNIVRVVNDPAGDRERFRALVHLDNAREADTGGEYRVVTPNGADRWLTIKAASISPAGSDAIRVVVMQDITRRKRTDLEIRRLNQELRAHLTELKSLNKELESFNYSISHDLRAPLRHINGFTKILLEKSDLNLPAEAIGYLEHVRRGAVKMGRMVDELLELSRMSRKEPSRQVTKLNALVEDVLLELTMEAQGREVEWRIRELPSADCDPVLTRQVFANLLANALKFTRGRTPPVIEVGHTYSGGRTILFVRDNGVGFRMEYADKIFGVFQRLHRAEDYEGTGIGLATVHRIVQKHGGRIWVDAEPDKGATFYFTLEPAPNEQTVGPHHVLSGD